MKMKNILFIALILLNLTATAQRGRNKKVSEMPTAANLTNSFVPIIQDSSGSYVNRKYPGDSLGTGGGGGTYTSSNGITLTGSNFKLGGTLTESTNIDGGDNPLSIYNLSSFNLQTNRTYVYSDNIDGVEIRYANVGATKYSSIKATAENALIENRGTNFIVKSSLSAGITTDRLKIDSVGNVSFPNNNSFTINGNSIGTSTAVVLTDAASIALTATKHTLATSSATRTFTISYTGDDITIEVTLSNTAATYTFPAGSLCISEGIASGDNTVGLAGVSGDKFIIGIKKIGSVYYVAVKNFGQ